MIDVRFTGDIQVSPAELPTVVSELPDSPYSEYRVRTAVERLYDTGRYAQVRVFRQDVPGGVALIIELTAKLRVRNLVFQGADSIGDRELRRRARTTADGEFAASTVERDRLALIELYREHGHFQADLMSRIEGEGPERDVTFVIDEGAQALVGAVRIRGAKAVAEEELRPDPPIRTGDPYSTRSLTRALGELRDMYARRGYLSMESFAPETP